MYKFPVGLERTADFLSLCSQGISDFSFRKPDKVELKIKAYYSTRGSTADTQTDPVNTFQSSL